MFLLLCQPLVPLRPQNNLSDLLMVLTSLTAHLHLLPPPSDPMLTSSDKEYILGLAHFHRAFQTSLNFCPHTLPGRGDPQPMGQGEIQDALLEEFPDDFDVRGWDNPLQPAEVRTTAFEAASLELYALSQFPRPWPLHFQLGVKYGAWQAVIGRTGYMIEDRTVHPLPNGPLQYKFLLLPKKQR